MKTNTILGIFLLFICTTIYVVSCDQSTPTDDGDNGNGQTTLTPLDSPNLPSRGYFKGFASILPPDGNFSNAYEEASQTSAFACIWGSGAPGAVWNLGNELAGSWGATFVEGYVRGNQMFPVIQMSFIDKDQTGLILKLPPGIQSATLSDSVWREAYKQAALAAVIASRPLYFSPGNELNRWFEQYGVDQGDPNGFQHFVSLYEEIYTAVKVLSPETRVFPVIAREIVDENREADLSVVDLFDPAKIDILVFTTYAFAVAGITSVSDIPDNYFSKLPAMLSAVNIPFGFTEAAWSTLDAFGGEEGQAAFLTDLAGRLTLDQGVNLHLLGWFVLFDLEDDPHQVGLIARDGREKPAYGIWMNL